MSYLFGCHSRFSGMASYRRRPSTRTLARGTLPASRAWKPCSVARRLTKTSAVGRWTASHTCGGCSTTPRPLTKTSVVGRSRASGTWTRCFGTTAQRLRPSRTRPCDVGDNAHVPADGGADEAKCESMSCGIADTDCAKLRWPPDADVADVSIRLCPLCVDLGPAATAERRTATFLDVGHIGADGHGRLVPTGEVRPLTRTSAWDTCLCVGARCNSMFEVYQPRPSTRTSAGAWTTAWKWSTHSPTPRAPRRRAASCKWTTARRLRQCESTSPTASCKPCRRQRRSSSHRRLAPSSIVRRPARRTQRGRPNKPVRRRHLRHPDAGADLVSCRLRLRKLRRRMRRQRAPTLAPTREPTSIPTAQPQASFKPTRVPTSIPIGACAAGYYTCASCCDQDADCSCDGHGGDAYDHDWRTPKCPEGYYECGDCCDRDADCGCDDHCDWGSNADCSLAYDGDAKPAGWCPVGYHDCGHHDCCDWNSDCACDGAWRTGNDDEHCGRADGPRRRAAGLRVQRAQRLDVCWQRVPLRGQEPRLGMRRARL